MRKTYFLFLTIAASFLVSEGFAQCTDYWDVTESAPGSMTREKVKASPEPTPKPDSEIESGVVIELDPLNATHQTRFKIVLKASLNSSFNKHNDYVLFEVAEDVVSFVPRPTTNPSVPIPAVKPGDPVAQKRCIVIPKGTPIFGLIDRSKSKTFLGFGGRSKLLVYVRELTLPGLKRPIPITFDEPLETKSDNGHAKPSTEVCTNFVDKKFKCVYGRRAIPSFGIGNSGIGTGVKGFYDARSGDDPVSRKDAFALGGVLFGDALLNNSWLTELLKSKDAILLPSMVFDVKLLEPMKVWVSLMPPDEKKPKEDEDK